MGYGQKDPKSAQYCFLEKKGLWSVDPHSIIADPDPAVFFSMRIRILSELTKPKKLPQWWKKTKNIAQKLKAMELVHIYFIFKNISTIFTNKFICLVYYRL